MSERQTGRTTRMMLEAIEHTRAGGDRPIIIISSRASESYFRRLWTHLGGEPRAVKFMTPTQEFHGLSSSELFVDHYVFEVGYDNPSLDYLLNRYRKEADDG